MGTLNVSTNTWACDLLSCFRTRHSNEDSWYNLKQYCHKLPSQFIIPYSYSLTILRQEPGQEDATQDRLWANKFLRPDQINTQGLLSMKLYTVGSVVGTRPRLFRHLKINLEDGKVVIITVSSDRAWELKFKFDVWLHGYYIHHVPSASIFLRVILQYPFMHFGQIRRFLQRSIYNSPTGFRCAERSPW